ncbi:MAG: DNA methyltransferase [Candidatus Sumerlaeota bacterium]|nr:DNA methyltransferase [Candidatus Sumerlaeota bacterium]
MEVNIIYKGDCTDILKTLPNDSIAACITDPPYNYEFIGREWDHEEIKRRITRIQNASTIVKNIPYGSGLAGGVRNERWYERNRENVLEYMKWIQNWGAEVFRVCKAGAYIAVFSSTRSAAHLQVALENEGFYSRDCLVFRRHAGIPKGLNIERKLEKDNDPCSAEWRGWHSCLRNEWEAIVLLQKPLINNYIQTIKENGIGLIKAINFDGSFQSNILEGYQRDPIEANNGHCTVKPMLLMKKLIQMFVPISRNNIVIDPFCGTGSTLIAAQILSVPYIGIEIENEYIIAAKKRLQQADNYEIDDLLELAV